MIHVGQFSNLSRTHFSLIDNGSIKSIIKLMKLQEWLESGGDKMKQLSEDVAEKFKQIRFGVLLSLALAVGANSDMMAQSTDSKIDYGKASRILNPDTLSGDNKAIFDHFVKLSSEEMNLLNPSQLKSEFAKLGLTPDERKRFFEAYKFYSVSMEGHKISCENWAEVSEGLDPRERN